MEYRFLDKKFELDLRTDADRSVFREVFLDRDYMCVDEVIRGAKKIVDVGAHIGLFTLYCKVVNKDADVFAYEPDEDNFARMKKHLKDNRISGVYAKNVAVGGEYGVRKFFVGEDSHNHSFFKCDRECVVKKVNVVSIEKVLKDGCDLLKMDCEGAEFEIISQMPAELFKKVGTFYIEYHEFEPDMKAADLKTILEKNGFKVRVSQSRYDKRMGFVLAKKV